MVVLGEFGDVVHVGDERYLLAAIASSSAIAIPVKYPSPSRTTTRSPGTSLPAHDLLGRQYAAARQHRRR